MSNEQTARLIQQILNRLDQLEAAAHITYNKGLWTPAFAGTTIAGAYTYVIGAPPETYGTYTRLGNQVIAHGGIQISAIGTPPTGTMQISGLPFAAAADMNQQGSVIFSMIDNFNYAAAAIELTGRVFAGQSVIILAESFDNAVAVSAPAANFTNVNCRLRFTVIYRIG